MWSWLLHRITGVILAVGLVYHFIFMHFLGQNNYSYEAVIQRLSDPSWKIFNIVFLVSAIYHGFYGLNGLVTEYIKNDFWKKVIRFVVFIVPIGLTFFGFRIVFL
ncbi:MAG: succinate dehydrogenase, hydrophobic membrane anchor protein [Thermodesulfovibrio sp.]